MMVWCHTAGDMVSVDWYEYTEVDDTLDTEDDDD